MLNDSCTDCVGMSGDISESAEDGLSADTISDVLMKVDTWIILALSFIVNMIGIVCLWGMFYRPCHGPRRKAGHRLVENDDLKQKMLKNQDISLDSLSKGSKTVDYV